MMNNIVFASPHFFWLLLLLPALALWYYFKRNKRRASLRVTDTSSFKTGGFFAFLFKALPVLKLLALASFIVAMARPQTVDESTRIKKTEGIDIVISIDTSPSMLARDLNPDRLKATKRVAADFVQKRPNDRIGLVLYSGEAYTKLPLTTDKELILKSLEEVDYNQILDGGTAIGLGLATAVNRLKDSEAKSKVVILLTDGENNTGSIDPLVAAELAKENKIKVYTIGVGRNGQALSPVLMFPNGKFQFGMAPVKIDENLLIEIADYTGGRYFRAKNNSSLQGIYDEIDSLEKTEIEEYKFTKTEEKFRPLVLLGAILLLFEFLMRNTLLRGFV